MRRRLPIVVVVLGVGTVGLFAGLFASGAFGQGNELNPKQALEASAQATGDANRHAPKEPITVVTSCPDENPVHPKIGIWAVDRSHGSPDKMFGLVENAATTFASDGSFYAIWAGAANDDDDQGALKVQAVQVQNDPCAVIAGLATLPPVRIYQTPFKGGPVTLVAIDGDAVVFQAADGTVGRLDYLTGTFSSSGATAVPAATAAATAVPISVATAIVAQ